MNTADYHKILVQSAASGVAFYSFNKMVNNTSGVRLWGKNIPNWAAGGIMGASGALLSDVIHKAILPHIHIGHRLENSTSAIVNPASSAAAWYGVARLGNPAFARGEMIQLLAFGAITELAANYAQKVFLSEDPDALKF